MAPRRGQTQAERDTSEALRQRYHVSFLGPDSIERLGPWARPCKHLLDQLEEILAINFDDYPPENHPDIEGACRKKLVAHKIRTNAHRCRSEQNNEAGWINNVASLLFDCINEIDSVCPNCKNELFRPDFVAVPENTTAAAEFLRRHRAKKWCKCNVVEKAQALRRGDNDRTTVFSNTSDERIRQPDRMLLGGILDQKYRRPDFVVGLKEEAVSRPDIGQLTADRCSPFKQAHTRFPFLVVEAKSEKGGPGFEEIERQSALAIRSCLRLQINLEADSRQRGSHPLVWFIGYQGDDWRLYYALPDGEQTKVVDCWHANVRDRNDALRLVLIVEWICYWARDVYREGIMKSLAAITLRERAMTPAETEFSSQNSEAFGIGHSSASSITPRSSVGPSLQAGGRSRLAEHTEAHRMRHAPDNSSDDVIMLDVHPSVEGDPGEDAADDPNAISMIDATQPLTEWKYFSIPEDETELVGMIQASLPDRGVPATAVELFHMLTDNANTLRLSRRVVEILWGGRSRESDEEDDEGDEEPIATLIISRSRFDQATWQVVRSYTAITCSQEAAKQLATVAQAGESATLPLSYWRAHDCCCSRRSVEAFQSIDGRQSASLAISQDTYCLVPDDLGPGGLHSRWARHPQSKSKLLFGRIEALVNNAGAPTSPFLPSANSSGQRPHSIGSQLIDALALENMPGMILKRPAPWPSGTSMWCFLSFSPLSLADLARQVALVREGRGIFAADGMTDQDYVSLAAAIAHL